MSTLFFDIGTIAVVVATLPGIYAAMKEGVNGYSMFQSGLMVIASASFFFAFYNLGARTSLLAQIPPFAFWSYVFLKKLSQIETKLRIKKQ